MVVYKFLSRKAQAGGAAEAVGVGARGGDKHPERDPEAAGRAAPVGLEGADARLPYHVYVMCLCLYRIMLYSYHSGGTTCLTLLV